MNSMVKSLILLLPNFISILACLYFKGNEKIRMIIWDSWGSINFPYNSKEMTEGWAINALGWPFSTGIKMFFSSFYHFSFGVYVPLGIFLSVSISLAFIYRILNLSPHRSSKFSNGRLFLSLFLLQLPGILFLCIMGCDYGRWIFLWFSSSLIMYFLADIKFLEFLSLKTIKFSNLCLKTGSKLYLNKINCYILFLLSGISLVHWNFLSYLYSTPVGYFINLVLYYFDYVTFIGYHSKV
ncbi:hypothetical protein O2K51_03745 [Apibacter raozihei]|uniref:hypothetical protein n=1 Tax=Apibacter TaxID=1778601 RepID=UPI000FE3D3CA|nr:MULTISPECIES: hypothetical protein [Apibacter]